LTHWFVLLYFRPKIYGAENIPAVGPFVVVANHASLFDPYFMAYTSKKRELYFIAKEELFRNPFLGWFLTRCNAFPVRRGLKDERAIGQFHELLRLGKPIGLFPEGTRTLNGELQPAKKGAGMLVYNARVPVIPAYIGGTYDCFPKGKLLPRPGKTWITYGPALPLEDLYSEKAEKDTYRKIADRLMENIAKLGPKT
jgi:1-acyl-sn-glycerol-3-phosphate acyltransferase